MPCAVLVQYVWTCWCALRGILGHVESDPVQAPWVPPSWQPCEAETPQIPDTLPFKPGSAGHGSGRGRGRGKPRGSSTQPTPKDPAGNFEAAAPSRRVRQRKLPPSAWENGRDWDDAIPTM